MQSREVLSIERIQAFRNSLQTVTGDLAIDFSNAIENGNCSENNCTLSSSTCCGAFENACTSHDIGKLYVNFNIEIFVPEFQSFSEGLTTLAEGTVLLDNISNTTQRITFRNTDLSFDTKTLQDGATFSLIGNNPLTIDSNDIDAMTETFLSLGRIPNGTYKFSFDLLINSCAVSSSIASIFEIFSGVD